MSSAADPAASSSSPPACTFAKLAPEPRDDREWFDRMRTIGQQLRAEKVSAIYLINGTFCGDDPHGMWACLDRWWPRVAARGRRCTVQLVDAVAGEAGNFTAPYAGWMERGLQAGGSLAPRVERHYWSGENHHLGRATGAMQLLDHLMQRSWSSDERILFLAQSHGGNALALLSHLLATDQATWREQFFAAADIFARSGDVAQAHPVWGRVRARLDAGNLPFAPEQLDLVTLGAPIAYDFAAGGCGNLLHLINHRPRPGVSRERTALPRSWTDFTRGADGDYVHQIGIAGSNFAPLLVCWRQWLANRRLRDVLRGQRAWRSYFARLRAGVRVRDGRQGRTRLIDYGMAPRRRLHHVLGHGVYTHHRHMVSQLEQIVTGLYDVP